MLHLLSLWSGFLYLPNYGYDGLHLFRRQVIEIMSDEVGKPFKAVVKRANNVTQTLTVTPDEANPDM